MKVANIQKQLGRFCLRINLLLIVLSSALTISASAQTEDITKQFNDAYRTFQSLNQEGKPKESLEFAKKALDLSQSLFDENSETAAALSYNYALNLMDVDQHKESAREFSKTVKIYTQVFGRNSESLASVYFDEGRANLPINRGKSRRAFERGINIIGDIYGTSSLNFADVNVQAGIILSEGSNLTIIERSFEKALNIYENEFGRDNLYTALVNFHLGKYHFMNANVSKSKNFLSNAIVGLESLESKDDVDQALLAAARGLFDRLGEVRYVREDYSRQVEEYTQERARINREMRSSQSQSNSGGASTTAPAQTGGAPQ
jgi:tetratricopeptide (TPR) repeat protein